jgi:hypothetical protein
VGTIHAPFPTDVECKMPSVAHLRISTCTTLAERLDALDDAASPRLRIVCRNWPELQMGIIQLAREGSPPPGLRLTQFELSRKSNQLVRARIRRIAVGTSLLSAPRTEPSGPHSGTRLPPRVFDGEALLGPRMKDAGPGEKVIRQLRDPFPGRVVLLTAPP